MAGIRTPNLKSAVKAKTSGRVTRAAKSAVNPVYGKKGAGWAADPKRAAQNAVYNKTTASETGGETTGCVTWVVAIIVMFFVWQFVSGIFS